MNAQKEMNDTLSNRLLIDFPVLFRECGETSMQRGFQCGDGWFELIHQLCQDIESVAREHGLKPHDSAWPQCREVKSKLGALRFVVFAVKDHDEMNERIGELRTAAFNRSYQIPENYDSNR
jgi:hypothetical protein